MGCAASIGVRGVGPAPPGTRRQMATSVVPNVASTPSKRRLTMKHTPKIDNEAAQKLQAMILEMSGRGKLELTSTVAREGSGQETGTLSKRHIPSLKQIPGVVFSMANLTELNLRCNEIYHIPKEIVMLQALEVLIVSENQLDELVKEVMELRQLKVLEVADNYLTSLPGNIGDLTKLEILRASRNKLTCLPDSIGSCERLKVINLYDNAISDLGSGISSLCYLQEVNVSNNALTVFPDVERWKNLRRLYLQVNHLTSLPPMGTLGKLKVFQAYQNDLTEFPSMANLVHLQKIDVNTNRIREIPRCFEQMSKLVHLNMRKNQLTAIPAFLCRCKSLEILDFGYNSICPPVPADLVTLPNLKTFLLDDCNVTVLPIELMGLRQVCRVNLGKCLRMDDQETFEVVIELRNICAHNGGWLKTG